LSSRDSFIRAPGKHETYMKISCHVTCFPYFSIAQPISVFFFSFFPPADYFDVNVKSIVCIISLSFWLLPGRSWCIYRCRRMTESVSGCIQDTGERE
jgi:hypothetical protein